MSENVEVDRFIVEPDSPLTAWGQVQRDLRRRVELNEFPPGSRIPSESDLSSHYGVSRATIRRAIEALAGEQVLRSRRGSGTFVLARSEVLRCDVDLLRPWRDQLLATGHVARSRLTATADEVRIPDELRRDVEYDSPDRTRFGLHVQEVDGVPIAATESWIPIHSATPRADRPAGTVPSGGVELSAIEARPATALVSAASSVRIAFATAAQASLLQTQRDASLLEVTTSSRLRETGELVELSRTSWLATRVRFTYGRSLTLGSIDMTELLARPTA